MLCKMRVTDGRRCSYSPDEMDYIEHFFYECPLILNFWKSLEQRILNHYDTQVEITVLEAIFGIPKARMVTQELFTKTNHIILIAKMCISI